MQLILLFVLKWLKSKVISKDNKVFDFWRVGISNRKVLIQIPSKNMETSISTVSIGIMQKEGVFKKVINIENINCSLI